MNPNHVLFREEIYSWSNTNSSYSDIFVPQNTDEIISLILEVARDGKKIISRGAGLSYGDQALNDGHIVIDTRRMNKILKWDKNSGLLTVEVGVNFDRALRHCLPDNWIFPVIPGTRYVTMGGALSNNVHGKNSYINGNFGEWVKEFKIVTASGELLTCSTTENSDLFFAAIGGSGLLGVVTEMTIQLVSISSSYLSTKVTTASSLDELLDQLDTLSEQNDFAIAQVDCFNIYKIGRGTVSAGSFLVNRKKVQDFKKMYTISPKIFSLFPKKWIPMIGKYFLGNFTMRWISRLKYHADKHLSPKDPSVEDIFRFTFLLDGLPNWKDVYRHGVFEYQVLLPKEKARSVIPELIELGQIYRMPGYLSAIKVHKKDDFLLSFSMDGYSFAMDIPRRPKKKEKQDELFRALNKIVIEAGGIVYLAKDANLKAEEFRQMYPNLEKFLSVKKKYDPNSLFESDMYRRIF